MSNVDTILKMFGLKASSITRTPESFSSEVYHITLSGGECVIIKIPYNKTKLARERLVLTRLQGLLPVPTVLDVYEGNEEITGALLLSLIPGEPIIGNVNRDLSYQMGQILARLHEVPAPGFGYDTAAGFKYVEGNRWSSFIEGTFESWRRDCKQILDCELYERSCRYFERAMNDMGEPDMASMIHMDFRPGNLLADGNTITGLIDFESSRGGAPERVFRRLSLY